ncbi:MAG TPA: hypothetical protein VMY37_35590 [Thermoguttaceae bacterium]|nr:hypothetical protein [Thermoguttaceae bacterium]
MTTKGLAFVCLLLMGCSGSAQDTRTPKGTIDPVDDAQVELTLAQAGKVFKLYRGRIYRVNEHSGRWDFVAEGYDPDFYEKNYVEQDGAIFRKHENGKLYRVRREFSGDFEDARTIRDLIGRWSKGWLWPEISKTLTPRNTEP